MTFLGLVGYCRTCIEDFSVLAQLLHDFLTQDSPAVVLRTLEGEQSFKTLKNRLTEALALALLDWVKEFELHVDVNQGHAKGMSVQDMGVLRGQQFIFAKC